MVSTILSPLERARRARRDALDRVALDGADDRPLFIGGSVRSGTTLLRVMVHSHPEIAVPREIHLTLQAFRGRRRFGDLRDPRNRAGFIDWMVTSNNGFDRLLLDEGEARRALSEAPPTTGSFVATLLKMYAARRDAPRFGEKRPLNVRAFPALLAMFPDLQFVDVVRDPRAVVASMRKLGWLDEWHGGSVPRALDAWVRSVRAGMGIEARYRSDQYLRLRYEDLLGDPERTLERLCRFAGLSMDHLDRMVRFHETDHEIPPDMRERYHPSIDRPLIRTANERWRKDLSEAETTFIETAARREMVRFGYEPTAPDVTAPPSMLATWAALRVQRPIRRLRWRGTHPLYRRPVAAVVTKGQRRRAALDG